MERETKLTCATKGCENDAMGTDGGYMKCCGCAPGGYTYPGLKHKNHCVWCLHFQGYYELINN